MRKFVRLPGGRVKIVRSKINGHMPERHKSSDDRASQGFELAVLRARQARTSGQIKTGIVAHVPVRVAPKPAVPRFVAACFTGFSLVLRTAEGAIIRI